MSGIEEKARISFVRLSRPHCAKCKERKCLSQYYYDFPCSFWAEYVEKVEAEFRQRKEVLEGE